MFQPLKPIGLSALQLFNFGRELRETHNFTLKDGRIREDFRRAHNVTLNPSSAHRDGFLMQKGYGPEIVVNGSELEAMNRSEERSYFAIMHSLLHADDNAPFRVTYECMEDETYVACFNQARWAVVGLCLPPEVIKELRYPIDTEAPEERMSNMANANISYVLNRSAEFFYKNFPDLLAEPKADDPAP